LLIALFGASVINALFFGCTMRPATNITVTGGWGSVACYSGFDDDVSTLACSFQYQNLTSDVTLSHFHIGDDSTVLGPVTFTFDPTGLVQASGTVYQKFVASAVSAPDWQMHGSTSFDDQVTACASGALVTGCYFNLHTATYGGGELRCELKPLTTTYSFPTILVPAPGSVNTTGDSGTALVEMAAILPAATPSVHAWGYQVDFSLNSPITNAHIHQGTTETDNTGPVKVQFDHGAPRFSGKFVGVALQGVTAVQQSRSNWPAYASDFDTAITNHFGYVNVHTTANTGGELRANISPDLSGASQVTLAFFAVVVMIASWMSL